MLLPDNIHPENSIYYNGAFVLEELNRERKCSLLDLYCFVKKRKNMSFSVFVLCVDWLFLLGVADFNSNDEIEIK
jgi:uncharacterized protein YfkK (UPF0435 family)